MREMHVSTQSLWKRWITGIASLLVVTVMLCGQAVATPVPTTYLHDGHTTYGTAVGNDRWEEYYVQWSSGIVAPYEIGEPENQWAAPGTTLAWHITYNNDGTYTYKYTWRAPIKDLSHIIIELTQGITIPADNITMPDPDVPESGVPPSFLIDTYTDSSHGNSNPGLPGSLYGIKINPEGEGDVTTYTFWFTVEQSPVWGNFYAKDGVNNDQGVKTGVFAYNTGFSDPQAGVFIARPDGGTTTVPEPATMLMVGTGLVGLAGFRRKFKK